MAKSKPLLVVEDKGQVNTNLTISNTDIVTMMMVKNRKFLQDKLVEISKNIDTRVNLQVGLLNKKILAEAKKDSLVKIAEAYINFIRVANSNPSIQYRIGSSSDFDLIQLIRGIYRGVAQGCTNPTYGSTGLNAQLRKEQIQVNMSWIHISLTGTKKNTHYLGGGYSGLPCKIKITIPADTEISELFKEGERIDNLLKNEKSLKEQTIANLTERALMNSPLLKQLTVDAGILE